MLKPPLALISDRQHTTTWPLWKITPSSTRPVPLTPVRRKPEHVHHVWAVDFLIDSTPNGGRFEFLTVIDEYSRSCLGIKVECTLTSRDVVTELERLITLHGPPGFIRCDNGPRFIAGVTRQFLATADIKTLFTDPGSPWQNGYCESFNSRFQDELLDLETFSSTLEARVLSEKWRRGITN